MIHYLIVCRSLTYAQRAARLLERSGITSIVTKAPNSMTTEGCAYCVKISEKRLSETIKILNSSGLGPGRILLQDSRGTVSEVNYDLS